MRVLVTGAGGFVGRHLARRLAGTGHAVLATVNRTVPEALASDAGIQITRFDLAGDTAFRIDGRIDAVIHCASALPSTISDPSTLYRTNINGTKRLLAAAVNAGARTIVNCSSMSAFGRISAPLVGLHTPSAAPDAYGTSKLDGETLIGEAAERHGLAAFSIRLPGVVGPGSHDNFLSNVMEKILAGEPVAARNPDALFNNIVHVDDLTGFMGRLIENPIAGHQVCLVASADPMPIKRVMSLLFATVGRQEDITYSLGGDPFLIDTTSARALGFTVPSTQSSVRRFAMDCTGPSAVP